MTTSKRKTLKNVEPLGIEVIDVETTDGKVEGARGIPLEGILKG